MELAFGFWDWVTVAFLWTVTIIGWTILQVKRAETVKALSESQSERVNRSHPRPKSRS